MGESVMDSVLQKLSKIKANPELLNDVGGQWVVDFLNDIINVSDDTCTYNQLKRCHAYVRGFTVHGVLVMRLLQSYNTHIAAILYDGNEAIACLDFLRYIYGYTSTSCQHIRKFFYEYSGNAPHFRYDW